MLAIRGVDECPGEFVYPARNGVWQWLQQILEVPLTAKAT